MRPFAMLAFSLTFLPSVVLADEPVVGACAERPSACTTPNCAPQPCAQGCSQPSPCATGAQGPCAPQPSAPVPYLYRSWAQRKQIQQRWMEGNRFREVGGRGLLGYVDADYGAYGDIAGGSFYARAYRLDSGLGIEVSWDFINYHGLEELAQVALLKYQQISERMKIYGLLGGGFTLYDPGYSAQAGVGVDILLTPRLSVHGDLRLSHVYSDPEDSYLCDYAPECGGGYYSPSEPGFSTTDMIINFGAGWRFVSVLERATAGRLGSPWWW